MTARSMALRMRSGTGVGPGICKKWRPAILGALVGIWARLLGFLRAFLSHAPGLCTRPLLSIRGHDRDREPRPGTAPESRRRGRYPVRCLHALMATWGRLLRSESVKGTGFWLAGY